MNTSTETFSQTTALKSKGNDIFSKLQYETSSRRITFIYASTSCNNYCSFLTFRDVPF